MTLPELTKACNCLREQVDTLVVRDSELLDGISALESGIASLEARTTSSEQDITGVESDIAILQGQLSDLTALVSAITNATVVLTIGGGDTRQYEPSANTDAAREVALRLALAAATAQPGVLCKVEIRFGDFRVTSGSPLTDTATAGNTILVFGEGSALRYQNPEDASEDSALFTGERSIINFGARTTNEGGTPFDCSPALQSVNNSLPIYPDGGNQYTLASGRLMRSGTITVPDGTYWIGSPFYYSPTIRFLCSSFRGTIFKVINGSATGAGSEVFFFSQDDPVAVNINNLFGTYFENFTLSCPSPSLNTRASGWKISGGQGCGGKSVHVTNFALRGASVYGCTLIDPWFNESVRGPNLDWYRGGIMVGSGSMEHCNAAGIVDAGTGRVYPSIRVKEGHYSIQYLQGEKSAVGAQTLIEVINVMSCVIGSVALGVYDTGANVDTMVRIAGTSENVRIGEMSGTTNGLFPRDVGTLVYDDSDFSPAGPGTPYTMVDIRGSYNQKSGGFVPGLDLPQNLWTGRNTFVGTMAPTSGLAVQVGVLAGSARIMLTNGDSTNRWEWDNGGTSGGAVQARWFHGTTGIAMTLSATGQLSVNGEYQVGDVRVVGNRVTGWAASTGTATKTTIATFDAPAVSASPTQAEVQSIADTLQALSRREKALTDALILHGLIGT